VEILRGRETLVTRDRLSLLKSITSSLLRGRSPTNSLEHARLESEEKDVVVVAADLFRSSETRSKPGRCLLRISETRYIPSHKSVRQQTPGPSLLSSLARDIHAFCIASNIESLLLSANNWWRFNVRSAFGICFTLAFSALKLQRLADFGANCLAARSGFRRRLLGARRNVSYIRWKRFGNES